MSDLHSIAEELRKRDRVRHYAPHPLAQREDDDDPRERSFEQVMEDETGKPAFGPL